MSDARRLSDGPSSSVGEVWTSASVSQAASRTKPKSMHHHQPYRIELLDISPVSVSLLWSTRPPPISAIPQEIINTQLRKRLRSRVNGSRNPSPLNNLGKATALPPSPKSASVSRSNGKTSSHSPNRSINSKTASASASPETTVSKLKEGLVATRSRNRKVTKIRLKTSPSTATPLRTASSDSTHSHHDDSNWPSDDGATAVEDDPSSASDASDSGYEGDKKPHSKLLSIFEDQVSIVINGQKWTQVTIKERGPHEAVVVISALEPEVDYDIQFVVKTEADAISSSSLVQSDQELPRSTDSNVTAVKAQDASDARSTSPSSATRPTPQRKADLQAELEASEALKASLLAEIKRARKDAAKAETSLKHEIDAIKRGMDRMNATDHRNRQKVLALQEFVKQTTVHVQDIHDEAEEAEKSLPEWEAKFAVVDAEYEKRRKEIAEQEEAARALREEEEAANAALEKEAAAARELEALRLEQHQQQIAAQQSKEAEDAREGGRGTLKKTHSFFRRSAAPTPHDGLQRHNSNPSQAVTTPPIQRGKGSLNGGRGGRTGYFGNRAASGPASAAFGGPVDQAAGFAGPSRTGFMQNFGRGFWNRSRRNEMDPMAPGYSSQEFLPRSVDVPTPSYGYLDRTSLDSAHGPAYGAYYAGGENFYGQPYVHEPPRPSFPSGVSEISQDDLYDPTLGFDPYDPSPDARRRSSLPEPPQYHQQHTSAEASSNVTALNPANPEFVPSGGLSPALRKGEVESAIPTASATLPSIAAVTRQSPPPGTSSLDHSPTSSSRFAFPLARHQPASTGRNSTGPIVPGPNNVLNPSLGIELGMPTAPTSSPSLHPMVSGTASPFPRHSPLLPQSTDAATIFPKSSPRFGHAYLRSSDEAGNSTTKAFAPYGPVDYDPPLEGFGSSSGLIGNGTSAGFGPSLASSSMSPYSSNPISSIFSNNDTWSAPGAPLLPSLGGGSATGHGSGPSSSSWIAPSPPLNKSTSGGDIWSPAPLAGSSQIRSSLSLHDTPPFAPAAGFGSRNLHLDTGYSGFNNVRAGSRAFGHASSGSSSSHHVHTGPALSSPLSTHTGLKSPPVISARAIGTDPHRSSSDQMYRTNLDDTTADASPNER